MTQSVLIGDHFHFFGKARRVGSIATIAIALYGCAAFTGRPTPVLDTDKIVSENSGYLTDPVAKFDSASDVARGGLTRRQWRDAVIDAYIRIADARYADFKADLNKETVG